MEPRDTDAGTADRSRQNRFWHVAWPILVIVLGVAFFCYAAFFSDHRETIVSELQLSKKASALEEEINAWLGLENRVLLPLVDNKPEILPEALKTYQKLFHVSFRQQLLGVRRSAEQLGLYKASYTCDSEPGQQIQESIPLEDCPVVDVVFRLRLITRESKPSRVKLWLRRIPER